MRDGPIRIVLKSLALLRFYVDLWLWRGWQRVRGRRPRHDLSGSCNGCGRCCETPTLQVSARLLNAPIVLQAFLWWQELVNGLTFQGADVQHQELRFTCAHYDAETKRCDAYATRPGMCRDYPKNLRYATRPVLFPECSYVLVDRLDVRLDVAMEAANLPPEKIAEIRQRLTEKTQKTN